MKLPVITWKGNKLKSFTFKKFLPLSHEKASADF